MLSDKKEEQEKQENENIIQEVLQIKSENMVLKEELE